MSGLTKEQRDKAKQSWERHGLSSGDFEQACRTLAYPGGRIDRLLLDVWVAGVESQADRLSTADEYFDAQEAFSEYANREHSYSTSKWMVEWNKLKKAVDDTYAAYLKARKPK